MKDQNLILNKILGIYFGYPECCIEDFLCQKNNKEKLKRLKNTDLESTGYVPCTNCFNKFKNLNKEELKIKFKRNIFEKQNTFHFLKITYSKEFVLLSKKYNFKINEYRNYLKNKIKAIS